MSGAPCVVGSAVRAVRTAHRAHVVAILSLLPLLPAPHPLHLSHTRIVVEGPTVVLNIRMFENDLTEALLRFHDLRRLTLSNDPAADSLFADYFASKFTLSANGVVMTGDIVDRGPDDDMWWFLLVFEAPAEVTELTFRNDILFDLFDDQRNVTRVLYAPTEKQRTYFSSAPDVEVHRFTTR